MLRHVRLKSVRRDNRIPPDKRAEPRAGNALQKMKAVGRTQIPGTLGYDLAFIRLITTDD